MASNLGNRIRKLELTAPKQSRDQERVDRLQYDLWKIYGEGEPYEYVRVTPEEFDRSIAESMKEIYGEVETSSNK
jgi:hypothetical protein